MIKLLQATYRYTRSTLTTRVLKAMFACIYDIQVPLFIYNTTIYFTILPRGQWKNAFVLCLIINSKLSTWHNLYVEIVENILWGIRGAPLYRPTYSHSHFVLMSYRGEQAHTYTDLKVYKIDDLQSDTNLYAICIRI